MVDLARYGFDPSFADAFTAAAAEGDIPARVVEEHRRQVLAMAPSGELWAQIPGRLYRAAERGEAELPAVGDFVVLERGGAAVRTVLPRRTVLARKAAGRTEQQVVAANVDVVFVAEAVPGLNLRRLERFLAVAADSGAQPVVVLTKADLEPAPDLALDVPVHAVSTPRGEGVHELLVHLGPGRTGVVIGPSGVGKSTLINAWIGEERFATGEVREDQRGRHTTTRRELVLLPDGSLVIDTPGVRELGLWDAGEGVEAAFADVAELARGCRFGDCSHEGEPGCAVVGAVERGELPEERLASYRKLVAEVAHIERQRDALARTEEKRRAKQVTRAFEDHVRKKRR